MIMPGSNTVDLPSADGLHWNGSGVMAAGVEEASGPTEGSLSPVATGGSGGSGLTVTLTGGACLTGAGGAGFLTGLVVVEELGALVSDAFVAAVEVVAVVVVVLVVVVGAVVVAVPLVDVCVPEVVPAGVVVGAVPVDCVSVAAVVLPDGAVVDGALVEPADVDVEAGAGVVVSAVVGATVVDRPWTAAVVDREAVVCPAVDASTVEEATAGDVAVTRAPVASVVAEVVP
jgi:hypothetical protein